MKVGARNALPYCAMSPQDGDTWYGVAGQYGVDATELANLNGRTLEEYLHSGETLLIPQ